MPIVSKNQGIAMNLANAIQKGEASPRPGTPSAEIAKSMKPSDLADFTGPIPASLPKKAAPIEQNVGGPGPGRPSMKVKKVGKPVKKMRIR